MAKSIQPTTKSKSIHIGKAGELRVAAELILRGLTAYLPVQDVGIDIIIGENGKRLQIKTSVKPSYSKTDYSWRYSFSIRPMVVRSNGKGTFARIRTRQDYSECDYFVFWCVQHNIFYIIPISEVGIKVSFCISTPDEERTYKKHKEISSKSKYEKYKNAWHLLI